MMTVNMMMIMMMMMMMMMRLLSDMMVIKNGLPRKHKLRKNFCPLLGILIM